MATEQQTDQTQGGEFEREPVPQSRLLGFKSFIGMYAGEHTAGTELMIGPLFVAAGVSAFDVVVGLIAGNVLAVLSWVFLCAPIATRARLTLYYQLEKICGRQLVTLYNLANGVMFCFLAGAMVTVSATALGVWFKFPMPELNDFYPNSVGWVIAVLACGALISIVAACGYEVVSKVANIAAPWMVLVFIAFGLIGLRQFINATDTTVTGLADVWSLAKTSIWKGGDPLPGQVKFTFWHVMFFAWFCNMAMHIGMSDLSVLRFAKKSWYGVAAGAGMFLGHFLAWLAASILYAFQMHQDPSNTSVLPGPLAYQAAGLAGLICVIIAGWTTANPTIYRAGLAFQAIIPKSSRFRVTLVTGLIATIAAMFPAIAMRLLDFVALYGMVLMPMGAVVFVDFWLIPKLGLHGSYAELRGRSIYWAAGLAWVVTIAACLAAISSLGRSSMWFVSLPGWFLAAGLYVGLSVFYQKQWDERPVTLAVARFVSWASLIVLVLFTILFTAGRTSLDRAKWVMILATVIWFASASLWMWKEPQDSAQDEAIIPGTAALSKPEVQP
jgi:purine-cytosine permease-like protein